MEKQISDDDFKAIITTCYFETIAHHYTQEHFYEIIEKQINEQLEDRELKDFELIDRGNDKWNIILTLDNEEESLYTINTSTFLK